MRLTPKDQEFLLNCLRAAASGPFFPDSEFSALIGCSKSELAKNVDEAERLPSSVVKNVLLNLTNYPLNSRDQWAEFSSYPLSDVRGLYQRWKEVVWKAVKDVFPEKVRNVTLEKKRKVTKRARCLLCGYSRKLRADGTLCYHTHPHNFAFCYGSKTKYHVPVDQLTGVEVGKLSLLL